MKTTKVPVLNDPIYGFIEINDPLIFELIDHPYFQRLRRISQMGLSSLVYPGARHSRFEHALGAMHLMNLAVFTLRRKGVQISKEEHLGLAIAMLLHDVGHGPFSHASEGNLFYKVSHEDISLGIIESLNREFKGKLDIALRIFKDEYPRKFMCQLVASQLDLDRLDYLKRDSFYSGATEGNINAQRIIAMLNVVKDTLVVEEKGIYSVEKFIMARRLMYWQVYLHKTSLSAELMLSRLFTYVRKLVQRGITMPMPKPLLFFFENNSLDVNNSKVLHQFAQLDDGDVFSALKQWQHHDDPVLSSIAKKLLYRNLSKIKLSNTPFSEEKIAQKKQLLLDKGYSSEFVALHVFSGTVFSTAYDLNKPPISFLKKSGKIVPFQDLSTHFSNASATNAESMHYLCYLRVE